MNNRGKFITEFVPLKHRRLAMCKVVSLQEEAERRAVAAFVSQYLRAQDTFESLMAAPPQEEEAIGFTELYETVKALVNVRKNGVVSIAEGRRLAQQVAKIERIARRDTRIATSWRELKKTFLK